MKESEIFKRLQQFKFLWFSIANPCTSKLTIVWQTESRVCSAIWQQGNSSCLWMQVSPGSYIPLDSLHLAMEERGWDPSSWTWGNRENHANRKICGVHRSFFVVLQPWQVEQNVSNSHLPKCSPICTGWRTFRPFLTARAYRYTPHCVGHFTDSESVSTGNIAGTH